MTSAKTLRKLGAGDIPVPDVGVLRDSALQLWDGRLAELGVSITPTPGISHDEVIDKLHSGTSPFVHAGDRREDGYSDYLVWRSAIDAAVASEERSAVFVSEDRAFGGSRKSTNLARELQAEADQSGVTVLWRRDLYQIVRVELVDAFDDRLHEFAGGRVVGVFRIGDYADASAAQHGLEGDSVFAFAHQTLRYLWALTCPTDRCVVLRAKWTASPSPEDVTSPETLFCGR